MILSEVSLLTKAVISKHYFETWVFPSNRIQTFLESAAISDRANPNGANRTSLFTPEPLRLQPVMSKQPLNKKSPLISFALAASLFAGEVPVDVKTASPDGVFQVRVLEVGKTNTKRLEITNKDGKPLFLSPPQIDGSDIIEFYADHLRWSPDSQILAISAGFPMLLRTYLFAWDGKTFQQIAMPEIAAGEDNPRVYPVEWKGNRTLHLKFSGPHAGKASGGGYKGTAVVQVDLRAKTSKKISEKLKRHVPDE
jgi:hypothetical protein